MKISEHNLSTTAVTEIAAMTRLVLSYSPQLSRRRAAEAALAHLTAKEEEAKA